MVSSATGTVTTHANFIPELWATESLKAVEFAANLQKRVLRKYEAVAKVGDTVHVPRRSNYTTQTKSSGLSNVINWEAITEGKQDISIATVEYAAFLLENVVDVQVNQEQRQEQTKKIGYALSRGREVTLAALIASLSQTQGTLNVEFTNDDYLAAYQKIGTAGLLEMSQDAGEDFSIFLSWQAWIAALKVDVFVNRQYNTAGDAIQRARIGDIYGFPVYVSNLMTSNSSGHDCVMMHRDCFALIVQKEVASRSAFIIENIADGVVGWNLYGTAEMNYPPETPGGSSAADDRGVWLKTV